ncbi:hypothetical protein [Paraburkholderia aspalathi]|uniref:hypothetical protein n=1 Tax=Paraburkholderia aspalathi TaxID=1324617 RepID=UPI0038BC4B73
MLFEPPPQPEDVEPGVQRLHLAMVGTRLVALERLVAYAGLPRQAVIGRLIDWADDTLSRSRCDEAAFARFIDSIPDGK